jgi:hypothetical protein
MQRKRHVRLHLADGAPSIEGLLQHYSTRRTGNHYVLELATVVSGQSESFELDGPSVKVPRERVVFIQELS